MILRGTRIVVPLALRKLIKLIWHMRDTRECEDQGEAKNESLVGLIGMKEDVLSVMAVSWLPIMCLLHQRSPHPSLSSLGKSSSLLTRVHLLILVDYYSQWIEFDIIRSTSSKAIVHCLDTQLARHGVPRS